MISSHFLKLVGPPPPVSRIQPAVLPSNKLGEFVMVFLEMLHQQVFGI